MKEFDYILENIQTDALTLDYFLVPWDTAIIEQPVAEIKHLEIRETEQAGRDYLDFRHWCRKHGITLCCCRVTHDQLIESMFLETQGFRFIELNYRPRLDKLLKLELPDDSLIIEPAHYRDRELLAEMAAAAFMYGRFHQDPRLGAKLGNRRYKTWLLNSFDHPHQKVFKCLQDSKIIAFFVVEQQEPGHCFWSLNGIAPGLQNQGLGKRVWRTMLRWHQKEGIDTVTTSISSHNISAFNLYISLGFRFPSPHMTFHWRPLNCIH